MKVLCIFAAALVAVSAQELYLTGEDSYLDGYNSAVHAHKHTHKKPKRDVSDLMGEESYPEFYTALTHHQDRRPKRDISIDRKTGDVVGKTGVGADGTVFGRLGGNERKLYGTAGYEHTIMDDANGRLAANLHGSHVISKHTHDRVGGGLNWQDQHSQASFDADKRIGGRTTYSAAAGGHWPVSTNGELSLGGTWSKREGHHSNFGGQAGYTYHFPG